MNGKQNTGREYLEQTEKYRFFITYGRDIVIGCLINSRVILSMLIEYSQLVIIKYLVPQKKISSRDL